jgi:dipicolinate synthase subunit A
VDEFFTALPEIKPPVFCGRATPMLKKAADDAGIPLIDYEGREEFIIKNTVPSAEGALQIAMEEMPTTIHGSSALVIGFGRIGKLLARHLSSLGAKVSVSARKPGDLAWISVYGYSPLETGKLSGRLSGFDVVFNTVPAVILTRGLLAELNEHCVIIDIASMPGGVDYPAARALSRKAIHALSLPGKVAPKTAGRAIRDVIYIILKEREEKCVGDKDPAQY